MTDGGRSQSRRGGYGVRGRAVLAGLLGLAACCGGALCAADDAHPSSGAEDWPRGNWTAVPRGLLWEYLSQRVGDGNRAQDSEPFIERIVYRGALQEDHSFSGGFDASIQADSSPVLELRHVSLFLGDLRWEDRPAEWGTADDGRSLLIVPERASALQGRWSLAHRIVGQRAEYRVQVPPAAATRFELSLPAGWTLSSSAGAVLPPDADGGGASVWVVELGRRHECLWTLERDDAPQLEPLLHTERSLVYSVGADHCQIHAEFETRVLRGPVHEFRFELPRGFQYTRTTYAGNIPLPVRLEEGEGAQILVVPVPELSAGLLEHVEIDGNLPSVLDEPWRLPEITLQGARTVRGTRRLRVEAPLAVSAMEPRQLRQTDATLNASGVDWFFEDLHDESVLDIRLAVRKPRIAARVAARVSERLGELDCDALVRLHTQSGTWYATDFQCPVDWEIYDVVPAAGAPDSGISYWSAGSYDGDQRLHVEFRQAASLQSPRSIVIRSRARRNDPGEGPSAPIPVPMETDDCRVLLLLDADWRVAAGGPYEPAAWAEPQGSATAPEWSAELDLLNVGSERTLRTYDSPRALEASAWRLQSVTESDSTAGEVSPSPAARAAPADGAARQPPVWSLTLTSRPSFDAADADMHEAVFEVLTGECGETLSFVLPPEFALHAVLVNGDPAIYSRERDRIELTELAPDVRKVEIDYSHPGALALGGRLSQRAMSVVPPGGIRDVVGFRWDVRLPRHYELARDPNQALLSSGANELSFAERILGPFFRAPSDRAGASGFDLETFTAASPPESITIQLWNVDVVRANAWAAFLCAMLLMLSIRRATRRWFPAALAALSVTATLAAVLAAVPGLLCGSVFLGLAVAALLPKRFTGSTADADSQERRSVATHESVAWTAVSLIMAMTLHTVASFCVADDDPATDAATTGAARARMLIPHADGAAARTVYVDPALARELADWQAAREATPRSLLRSARYHVSADPEERVRAEIDVLVRSDVERVPVRLPFAGVTFRSSEDCLLDGVPAPLSPATDGTGMIVEVFNDRSSGQTAGPPAAAFRNVAITLTFRPRISEAGTAREARLPVILDSRMILERADAGGEPPQVFRGGALREDAAGWQVDLGPVGELGVSSGAAATPATPPARTGSAVSLIELRPGSAWVRTRLELRHAARAFGPDPATPQIVELSGLCDVREVASPNLESYHVTYRDPERTIVELVFNRLAPGESVVHLSYARPPSIDGEWRFPDVVVVDDAPLSEHLVGITSSRGFRIDTDSAAADAEGVRVITPETFVERVSEESGWRAPDVAWQLTPPVVLPIRIDQLEAERSAGIEQALSVGDDRTTWRAELSMNVVGAPATQHRIALSPSVQVESVSVMQDGAERLLSWSQDDEGLVVFLTGVRTGVQDILLEGHCVATEGAIQDVPAIRIPEATVGKSETVIENEGRHLVELLDSRGVLTGVLTPFDDAQEAARASSSRFDSDDTKAPSAYRIQPPRSGSSLEVVVAVSPMQLTVGFRPRTSAAQEWELAIPEEWGDGFSIEPRSALVGREAAPAGGWNLDLRTNGRTGIVSLSAALSAPPGDQWTLPLPTARGAEIARSLVAVASEVPFAADQGEPAVVETDPVWRAWMDDVAGGDFGPIASLPLENLTLTRTDEDDRVLEAGALRTETVVFFNPDRPIDIRTAMTLNSRKRALDLEFTVPRGVEVFNAEFNGRTVEAERGNDGTAMFRIVSDQPIGLSRLVVNWRSQSDSKGGFVRERLPRPIASSPDDVVIVVPPAGRQFVVRDGMTVRNELAHPFTRDERSLSDPLESAPATFVDPGLLAGTPEGSTLRFVAVDPALVRGFSAVAVCSGLLAGVALFRRLIPATWLQFWRRRDSLLGLALLGFLWWALLPLGVAGLVTGVVALLWEAADVIRDRSRMGRAA